MPRLIGQGQPRGRFRSRDGSFIVSRRAACARPKLLCSHSLWTRSSEYHRHVSPAAPSLERNGLVTPGPASHFVGGNGAGGSLLGDEVGRGEDRGAIAKVEEVGVAGDEDGALVVREDNQVVVVGVGRA